MPDKQAWFVPIKNECQRMPDTSTAVEPPVIDLGDLGNGVPVCITERIGGAMAEAAAVCFDFNGHLQNVIMRVSGSFDQTYRMRWSAVTQAQKAGWKDMPYTIEQGAYGVGILLIRGLTGHTIIERAYKTTGFDYWLGDDGDMFQRKARLEVSGTGDPNLVNARVARKKRQTTPTDHTGLPAYIVVVDFKTPQSWVERK